MAAGVRRSRLASEAGAAENPYLLMGWITLENLGMRAEAAPYAARCKHWVRRAPRIATGDRPTSAPSCATSATRRVRRGDDGGARRTLGACPQPGHDQTRGRSPRSRSPTRLRWSAPAAPELLRSARAAPRQRPRAAPSPATHAPPTMLRATALISDARVARASPANHAVPRGTCARRATGRRARHSPSPRGYRRGARAARRRSRRSCRGAAPGPPGDAHRA